MEETTYSMSFTVGALLYHESVTVADLYQELESWETVRDRVIEDNLLQIRTQRSSQRIYQEVSSRLKILSRSQLSLFQEGTQEERKYLLWLAICKRYRFIHDFAVEVIREKYLRLDLELSKDEYDIFYYDKAEWHPEVERIADRTRRNQRQMIFKMLRDAELLSSDGRIVPALLSPLLVEVIAEENPAHLAIFPVSAADIQGLLP